MFPMIGYSKNKQTDNPEAVWLLTSLKLGALLAADNFTSGHF